MKVSLPWSAWSASAEHALQLPERWSVDVLEPRRERPLAPDVIRRAIERPVAGPPLRTLASGRRTACVVIDDLTRPTPVGDLLPPVLAQLAAQGITTRDVTVLIATGAHAPPTSADVRTKLGAAYSDDLRLEIHDPAGDLVNTGLTYGERPLRINRTFCEADIRIAVGCVLPNAFAGYGGGAKAVIPGLSDLDATARSHKFVQLGLRAAGGANGTPFRVEIEKLVRQIGLEFVVCVVTDRAMKAVGVYAGDLVDAHRAACAHAAQSYRTPLARTYDALILNAFPKDTDLVQAGNAFLCLRDLGQPAVRHGGTIVLAAATSRGAGKHGLFSPGGTAYRLPRPIKSLDSASVIVYAPNVTEREVHDHFWRGYSVVHDSAQLAVALGKVLPADAAIGVVPVAALQHLVDERHA